MQFLSTAPNWGSRIVPDTLTHCCDIVIWTTFGQPVCLTSPTDLASGIFPLISSKLTKLKHYSDHILLNLNCQLSFFFRYNFQVSKYIIYPNRLESKDVDQSLKVMNTFRLMPTHHPQIRNHTKCPYDHIMYQNNLMKVHLIPFLRFYSF